MKEYIVRVYEDRVEWYNKENKLHREGGLPAIERCDGSKEYWVNGKLHREGGLPAIERGNGSKEYWVNGRHITKSEAKRLNNSCEGNVIKIDGKKYKLTEI